MNKTLDNAIIYNPKRKKGFLKMHTRTHWLVQQLVIVSWIGLLIKWY